MTKFLNKAKSFGLFCLILAPLQSRCWCFWFCFAVYREQIEFRFKRYRYCRESLHRNEKGNAALALTENISMQNSTLNVRLDHRRENFSAKARKMIAPFLEMWKDRLNEVKGTEYRITF